MSGQMKDGGAVDVLAEMQADIDALEQRVLAGEFTLSRGYNKVNRLRSIHAAVAELVEADRDFDAAELELGNAKYGPYTKRLSRYNAAEKRRSIALANVGGAK